MPARSAGGSRWCGLGARVPAYEAPGRWRERIRAGLTALLGFLDDEPCLGRLCVVEALGGGPLALELRANCMAAFIAAVDEAQGGYRARKQPPPMTAEGVVGAVLSIVHSRILARDAIPAREAMVAGSLLRWVRCWVS